MKETFADALALVLKHEGGFVHHPADPGGATNRGVTQRVYDGWRKAGGLSARSVRHITAEEVEAIYRRDYWDRVCGDALPPGVDYAVFDFAVNSGVKRASQYLQIALGVTADSVIGAHTVSAAQNANSASLITSLCTARLNFLERLRTFPTFGKGWTKRVAEVEAHAHAMAQ